MAVLRAALADVLARRGRLVEVVGEPGIGKSRLVEELLTGADEMLTVWAPCEEYESSTAYFPFRRLLREVLAFPADAAPSWSHSGSSTASSANAPHLAMASAAWDPDGHRATSDDRGHTELHEQFRKSRLEDVVIEFLTVVMPTSTVLVVEDAHLMDDASAALMHRLCEGLEGRPWLLLVIRRDQTAGFVPAEEPGVLSIRLAPLTGHGRAATG